MSIDWPNLVRSLVLAAIFSGLFAYFYPRGEFSGLFAYFYPRGEVVVLKAATVLEPLHMTKDDCRVMLRGRPHGRSQLRFGDPLG